jgi:hypothetical protein
MKIPFLCKINALQPIDLKKLDPRDPIAKHAVLSHKL